MPTKQGCQLLEEWQDATALQLTADDHLELFTHSYEIVTKTATMAEYGDRLGEQDSTPKLLQQPPRYSAATGGNMLGELTLEEDSAEGASLALVAPGALTSASGLSERRDFPSK
jgi:hypothetical protein